MEKIGGIYLIEYIDFQNNFLYKAGKSRNIFLRFRKHFQESKKWQFKPNRILISNLGFNDYYLLKLEHDLLLEISNNSLKYPKGREYFYGDNIPNIFYSMFKNFDEYNVSQSGKPTFNMSIQDGVAKHLDGGYYDFCRVI